MSELRQTEALLNTLEDKLHNFRQILPKLDSRRSLLGFGGTILKAFFGTATTADVHQLHKTLDNLQSRNSDIVHPLADQVTYIRKLNSITDINTDAIENLSTVVRDAMVRSHEKYKQVTKDIMWLN